MRSKFITWLAVLGLAGCASQDPALVGRWQGERSATPECHYVAWTKTMTADGRFGEVFYEDAARSKPITKRGGYWVTNKSFVLFDAVGSKKYNTYHYQFIDADTVYYKSITPDTGCRFVVYTLHRVPG